MRFIIIFLVLVLCNADIKAQNMFVEQELKSVGEAAELIYKEFDGSFDRDCFLIGTLDDNMGHYRVSTANKSIADIDDDVKWMFQKRDSFIPDTLLCQRVTSYGENASEISLALFVSALFKP